MENIFFAFILPFIGVLHLIGCKVQDGMPLIIKLYDSHSHDNDHCLHDKMRHLSLF